jgi:HemY protein
MFKEMAGRADTKALGLHGLFIEARRRGDAVTGRLVAEEAAQLAAPPAWAAQAVLDFRAAASDWPGALHQLARNAKLGLIDKPTHARRRAVLLTAQALAAEDGDRDFARERVLEALRLAPTLVPAAALGGRMLGEAGELRKAARIIETAWKANPHPDLAEAYAHLRPGDSARDRLARVEALAAKAPPEPAGRVEAALAVARAALDAREFAAARRALEPLAAQPTKRVAELMAELEELESGDVGRAREWMARALHARRDPAWTADGFVSEHWLPVSPVTGRLDAFEWKDPLAELAPEPVAAGEPVVGAPVAREPAGEPAAPAMIDVAAHDLPAPPPSPPPAARQASAARVRGKFPEAAEAAPDTFARGRAERIIPLPHVPDDPGPEPDASDEPRAEPADAPGVEWSSQGWRKLKELFR